MGVDVETKEAGFVCASNSERTGEMFSSSLLFARSFNGITNRRVTSGRWVRDGREGGQGVGRERGEEEERGEDGYVLNPFLSRDLSNSNPPFFPGFQRDFITCVVVD